MRERWSEVLGVHLMEFGIPEAMWHLQVKDFVAIVTMDAHGNSLHAGRASTTAHRHSRRWAIRLEKVRPAVLRGIEASFG